MTDRHRCAAEGGTRRVVGTCARADRPAEPPAVMTVAVCRCGADVAQPYRFAAAEPAGPGSWSGMPDEMRPSAGTPDDVAAFYQRRVRGFR